MTLLTCSIAFMLVVIGILLTQNNDLKRKNLILQITYTELYKYHMDLLLSRHMEEPYPKEGE